jgi:hypothetical protein
VPDALTSTFTALECDGRGDVRQLDGTKDDRFSSHLLSEARRPQSAELPQIGWERTRIWALVAGRRAMQQQGPRRGGHYQPPSFVT